MTATDTARPPRRWRRRTAWLVVVLLIVVSLRWVSQPSQVAGLILGRVGAALGLEFSASGASEYRLRGTPMLEVRDLVVREPGAHAPLLRAGRVYLALPWSTIRAGGADLTVERVELDAPQLDVEALRHWLASRPPSQAPVRIPTLTRGLHAARGRVAGAGWSIDDIDLSFPSLQPDRPVRGRVAGRVTSGATRVPFDLYATLKRVSADAALGLSGTASIETASGSLPMLATVSARLHDDEDGLGLDRIRLSANARYVSGGTQRPFALGLAGTLRFRDGVLRVEPLGAATRGAGSVPTLDAGGGFSLGDVLALQLKGKLYAWPQGWPALPPPLGQSRSPLPFALDYRGSSDLSGATALHLQRDDARFEGQFRLPALIDWIDAKNAPLLPPLTGRLAVPTLEVSGATLEGVEITIDETDAATPPGAAKRDPAGQDQAMQDPATQ